MPLNIWNLEWLNHNSQRSYPLCDWATKECSESSAITLPDDFLLALSLAVNACHSIDIDGFYIKSILVMDTGCSVIIGYDDKEVAITHIVANSDQMTYALVGLGEFDDIVGYIAINPHSTIMSGLSGYYNFSKEATCLEADCIRPMIKSISALQVENGSSLSSRMYGDIILRAGANINLAVNTEDDTSVITISAIDGSGLSALCECEEDKDMPPIRSINGATGNDSGYLSITGTDCLSIDNGDYSLTFTDTCADPCCGCEELDALYENVKDMIDGAATLQNAIEDLSSRQQQIELVYGNEGKTPSCNCAGMVPDEEKKEADEEDNSGVYYVYRYEFMRRYNDQGNYVSPIAYGWGKGCKTYPLKVGAYMGHGDPIDAEYLIGDYYHDDTTGATLIVADVIIERVCKYKDRSEAPDEKYYFSHRTEFLDTYINLNSKGSVLNPDKSLFIPQSESPIDSVDFDSVSGNHPSMNQACIEGRDFIRECIAKSESTEEEEEKEPELACAKSIYRYELQVEEGDALIHTFMFSRDGDIPLLGVGDTITVTGTEEDYDTRWKATISNVKLYRSFKYWYEADQPQLYKDDPDQFGDYWIKKNDIEEYRCYFDAVPKKKKWGPENTNRNTDL